MASRSLATITHFITRSRLADQLGFWKEEDVSTGPWKSKKPPPSPQTQSGPLREIADLFLERSAHLQSLAQTDGHISAWFRTIGVKAGEIPLPDSDEAA